MTLLACDLTLSPDMRLHLDDGRQNVVADAIRRNFAEIIKLPPGAERNALIGKILKPEKSNDRAAR